MTDTTSGPVVDIHCHVALPELARDAAAYFAPEHDPFSYYGGESSTYNEQHFADIIPKLTQPEERLADMDRMGVDVQAISVAPPQYYYWTPPEVGADLTRRLNERLAEIVAGQPRRFVALGTVPLQDTDLAVRELSRVMTERGFAGVEICSNVNGMDFDHPRFEPFFARAAALGALIVIHPHGFTHGERLTDYYLTNVIGNPLDSTIAVSRLIFGGVLERHPDLKICVVHGGGYLPFYPARMDHAYEVRPECRKHISRPPSAYLQQLFVDTVVFDPTSLGTLVQRMGPDHVLLGTDYPYDMGEPDPVGLVRRVEGLSAEERDAILGGNARRLLGMT